MPEDNTPEDFDPNLAVFDCFYHFSEFSHDFDVLVREGYIKETSLGNYKWLKSKTSLAEYFKWAFGHVDEVRGGFWAPIENTFKIKRHSLRRLASRNGSGTNKNESRDFKKIKAILEPLRLQEQERRRELQIFGSIKRLVTLEAKDGEPETIHEILEKISEIIINFYRNCRQK
jgi:hypothetical protein